jgi:hypothetical protein
VSVLEPHDRRIIHPGDTLILQVNPETTQTDAETLQREVKEHLPSTIHVVVIASQSIEVYRPDSSGFDSAVLRAIRRLIRHGLLARSWMKKDSGTPATLRQTSPIV